MHGGVGRASSLAVEARHIAQPPLERQGAFGDDEEMSEAPLPVPGNPPAIALPDTCNLDEDFGEDGGDGWGSC